MNVVASSGTVEDSGHSKRERIVFPLFLYVSLGITSIVAIVVDGMSRRAVVGLVLSGAIALLYPVLGRPALACKNERQGALFLILVVPLATALFLVRPFFLPALFGLYPLCFALVSRFALQVLAAGSLSAAVVLSTARDSGWSSSGWTAGAVIGSASFAFSVIMGGWISGIIDESRARQGLIDELQATRAQLAQVEHDAGVRAERERLSAEIHDTLAQGFSSLLMLVRSAHTAIGTDDARARALLNSAEQTAKDNLAEARSLVQSLAPVALQDASLSDAVRRLAKRTQDDTGMTVVVNISGSAGDAGLTPAEDVVLLRAIQESLTNVRRHALATGVTIAVRYDAQPVTAAVTDNGVGFDPATTGGSGLAGMRSRLNSVGGRLTVNSSPGLGTTVELCLS